LVAPEFYETRSIRRRRRTAGEIEVVRKAIFEVLSEQHPATCRGLFYALVTRGVVGKTETEYKKTVVRLASEMRRAGHLPFGWLADNTRWMRKPTSWHSLEEALEQTAQNYRRALWPEQDAYVEVWLEKDALSGVIYGVTQDWDVPLMVTRGYASLSFLHSAAEQISRAQKPVFLYYLGDYDPSGVDIPLRVERDLRELAPGADLTFTRLAVNPEQIDSMRLPTRPTKTTDPRAIRFVGESVEVDAIPAPVLRQLVRQAIASHVDRQRLESVEAEERLEQAALAVLSQRFQRSQ